MTTVERNIFGDLKNCLVAVFDKDTDLSELMQSLEGMNLQEETRVIRHDNEVELEDPQDQNLLKAIRHAFSDKTVEVEESLTNALRMGKQVVQTCLSQDDDTQKQRVSDLYLSHNGEFVHYFGEWSIEVIKDNAPEYSHNT